MGHDRLVSVTSKLQFCSIVCEMGDETATLDWSSIAAVSSAVIALAALGYSVFMFNSQQNRAEEHAQANLRPILTIRTQAYANRKAIILRNVGVGPAVITSATFSKEGKPTNNVVELFEELPIPYWETYINLPDGTVLPAQEDSILVLQTSRHLMDADVQGVEITKERALEILEQWDEIKSGIHASIKYEDVLGNTQNAVDLTLK